METDGRDTNRAGRSSGDNVVPFPRDWIGPLDDLVPFGSAADAGPEDEELEQALVADSFWSASSASLHQVVEAPMDSAGVEAPALKQPEVPAETTAVSGCRRVITARVTRRSAARPTSRFRMTALLVAASVAVAGVVSALEAGSGTPIAHRQGALAAGLLQGVGGRTSPSANESARLSRLLVTRAIERTSRRSHGGGHRSRTHHHAVSRATTSPSSVGTATHVNVSYQMTQPTTAASASTSTPAPSEVSTSSVQTDTAATSDAGASSSKAGPSGAGAPFGPGQMNGG